MSTVNAPRANFRLAAEPAVEDAIGWMVNLNSGEATQLEHAEFRRWYEADPANRAAWGRLSGSLGPLRRAAEVPLPKGALARRKTQSELSRRRFVKSAVVSATLLGGAVLADRAYPLRDLLADRSTGTGQRETVALEGGGSVTLAPRTAINFRAGNGADRIEVLSGELFVVDIGSRARPLHLTLRDWLVQPTSGRVALRDRDDIASVTALDDALKIDLSDGQRSLDAGRTLMLSDGVVSQHEADVESEAALANGLLIVKDRPLEDVISALRPYFVGVIRASSAARGLRIGGVFHLEEPRRTLAAINETLPLTIRQITPFWLTIDVA